MDEADAEDAGDERGTTHDKAAVRATYDRIADHFAQTREYPWPEVEAFVTESDFVPVALDLGCGNGRHAELLAGRADRVVAADASRGLLATARERATDHGFDAELVQADAARLPLRDGTVGLAVYVATLHHLPSEAARRASLDELARVLAPGGRALVSAWSTAHDRFDREDSEAQCASDSRAGKTRETSFDTTIDWTLPGGETVGRFYHVYAPGDFEAEIEGSELELVDFEVSSGNCYATVRGSTDEE